MDPDRDLAEYYEREARARARRPRAGRREEVRSAFIEQLRSESRRSVLDIGAGPGRDGGPFVDAGMTYLGIDRAHGNAVLAAELHLDVLQGSLFDLPIRPGRVDAVWTMSTLVHVPDVRFDEAMHQMTSCLASGGLLAVGLWGGLDSEEILDSDHFEPPRFFSLRSHDRITAMLGEHGVLESFETWKQAVGIWEYQFAVLRV